MKKFEYNCFWVEVFNSTSLQDFLDEKGKMGWEIISVIPSKDTTSYQTLFIMKKDLAEE